MRVEQYHTQTCTPQLLIMLVLSSLCLIPRKIGACVMAGGEDDSVDPIYGRIISSMCLITLPEWFAALMYLIGGFALKP